MSEFDFFNIDGDDLWGEWSRQARLFFVHAVKVADAKRDLAAAESQQEIIYAEFDQKIRMEPEKFGLKKTSEGAIKQSIYTQSEYAETSSQCSKLKHRVDVLQAAVSALDHRKRALENMVELEVMGFHAEPKAKANSKTGVQELEKKQIMGKLKVRRRERKEPQNE